MRLTIVKPDGKVIIDGVAFDGISIDGAPENFYVLQWYETYGDMETLDPVTRAHGNVHVDDLTPFQPYIDAWNEKKNEHDNPPPPPVIVPAYITRRQCSLQLLAMGMITNQEAIDMVRSGIPPVSVLAYINALPTEEERVIATINFAADNYYRNDPTLIAMMVANGGTSDSIDQFFIAAGDR